MGEGGTIGAPACVANAVDDALAHLGVEVDRLPIRPDRLLAAMRAARDTEGSRPMSDVHLIAITVNGTRHEVAVEARRTLADVLRHDLGHTGTHLGCEHGICGACTVLARRRSRRARASCSASRPTAREVETVEGLAAPTAR